MTKRTLSLLLAVLLLLTAFPFSALAETDELPPEELPAVEETHSEEDPRPTPEPTPEAEDTSAIQEETSNAAATSGTCGDNLTWSFNKSTGTLTIKGSGDMEDYYDWDGGGAPDRPWYAYRKSIRSLSLPDGLTLISGMAFAGCVGLTSVTIPGSVKCIDMEAFCGCKGLTSIVIENGVTFIDMSAFSSCTSLSCITIPSSVTAIGDYAFYKCSRLASIAIPDSITSIGWCTFADCTRLKNVYYAGTPAQRAEMDIDGGNDSLLGATWQYNSTGPVKPLNLPAIKTQPKSVTVNNGKAAKFSVKATGKNLKYQWEVSVDGGETWAEVAKATKSSLSVKTVKAMAETENLFRCKVTNADGSVYTDAATLTVKLVPPVITGQPAGVSVRNGKNANLTVKVKGAKKYQWQVNDGSGWTDIPKATKAKLTLNKVTVDMNDNWYRCVASNADGEVTSEVAILSVYLVYPTIATQPKDVSVKDGGKATFTAKAKDANRYQWQVNDGSGWANITKATSSKLVIAKVGITLSGNRYRCLVSNGDGSVCTNEASLYVEPVTYSISFNYNGGKGDTSKVFCKSGETLSWLPTPFARIGYSFAGWYTQKSGGMRLDETTAIIKSMTVYARWEKEVPTPGWKYLSPEESGYDAGAWYYVGNNGKYLTGWQTINGKRYYFGTDGAMYYGVRKVGSTYYYFTDDGGDLGVSAPPYGYLAGEGFHEDEYEAPVFTDDAGQVLAWDGFPYFYDGKGTSVFNARDLVRYGISEVSSYTFYDIDKDGIREFIVESGDGSLDAQFYFYRMDADREEFRYIGAVDGWHSVLQCDKKGNLIVEGMSFDEQWAYQIGYKNGSITSQLVKHLEFDTDDGEYSYTDLGYADVYVYYVY